MALYYLNQYISKTLNTTGGIDNSQTSDIELSDTSGLDITNPGIACISYSDPIDTDNAEWITYTSINDTTKKFVGVARGQESYSAKAHSKGVTIAFPISKSHINGINDILNGTTELPGDISLPAGSQLQVNSADPKRIITLPAGGWAPTTTSGCAGSTTAELATNDIDYTYLAFDKDSDEYAFMAFQMPNAWDAGTIEFRYLWSCASGDGGASETVTFALSGRSYANDDAIDQATGTAVSVADTWIADEDLHISDWSSAVTLAGTPAAGEWIHLKIMRDVSEDDLGADTQLIGVQIRYTESLATDA